ncbi:hypothetical protein [Aphanothece sacrum]|uniref:S23 ribosomal protein n=1 Tax=Aphanothece sacrum FPU1 TaxID=1920663 RepID=A0A401IIU7_APHSA|nr:hypothetical protein [Aphanothece sacrum]GBF81207.1 S23 ribosomal protein [Aphanothece sacrum FPU1]GBF83444.1 S23 ribosomal protein [Aphanothece sacrum FPU3]
MEKNNKPAIKDHKELEIYKKAFDAAMVGKSPQEGLGSRGSRGSRGGRGGRGRWKKITNQL